MLAHDTFWMNYANTVWLSEGVHMTFEEDYSPAPVKNDEDEAEESEKEGEGKEVSQLPVWDEEATKGDDRKYCLTRLRHQAISDKLRQKIQNLD